MDVFYMDESGFTGGDLLHSLQPFQCASTVSINHEDACYLIRQHFPKLKAPELKFSSLIKRDTNLKPLYELQRDLLENFPCVSCVADKKFILILLFVTHAVEPYYHARGINLLNNGGHFLLASNAFFAGPAIFGDDFELILRRFQHAMKLKTHESVKELINAVRSVDWFLMKEFLGPLATEDPACINEILDEHTSTDAAFIILNALISQIEMMSVDSYRIEHDRSKNLLQYHDYLLRFMRCDQIAEFRLSDKASIRYPLKLRDVTQVDSLESPGVQLCDVLAGGCLRGLRDLIRDSKPGLYSPFRLYQDHHLICFKPNRNLVEEKAFRQRGQNAAYVDFISRILGT